MVVSTCRFLFAGGIPRPREYMEVQNDHMAQALMVLGNKRPLLSAPGDKLTDLYYSRENSFVELVECGWSTGRFVQSLGSTAFGASNSVIVPIGSFLSSTYLHLELPQLVADQTLCKSWGYAAIESISFLFGSSNVSQLTISGQSVWQLMLAQCETADKRNEYARLGGEEWTTVPVAPPGELVPKIEANVLLPFPWSDFCGLFPKLPYDTNLLRTPITVTVKFNAASSIYGGNGARPAGFDKAVMTFRQGDLSNKGLSLASILNRDPTLMYGMPFVDGQSFTSPLFQGVQRGAGSFCEVALQQFISADVVGIVFGCVRSSRLSPTGNNSPATLAYDDLEEIYLRQNGQTIFYSPGKQYKLTNMNSILGGGYVNQSVIQAGAVAPFVSIPQDVYAIFIDLSRNRSACYAHQFANVPRFAEQTLSLQFNTPTTENYRLFATYLYNKVCESQQGETRIIS